MTKKDHMTYGDLVRHAFIDSIRSVLIVDDDYPTLDEILSRDEDSPKEDRHKKWRENPQEMREVIREFRSLKNPCMVDVHDGSFPEENWMLKEARRLQQTDLLVLDFELDRNSPKDGSRAITIAREAMLNAHFNLIIVHTHLEIEEVFNKIILGLLPLIPPHEDIEESVSALESHRASGREFEFGLPQYLDYYRGFLRKNLNEVVKKIRGNEYPWNGFESYLGPNISDEILLSYISVFSQNYQWAMGESAFAPGNMSIKDWSNTPRKPYWIRCSNGFIAFKSKGDKSNLVDRLCETLVAWCPHQSRLILTKLRAAMNERGVEVQDDALGETTVGAIWYHDLLQSGGKAGVEVEAMARNHAELLFDCILPDVVDFTRNLLEADSQEQDTPSKVVKEKYGVDLDQECTKISAVIRHNAFVGSKLVRSDHLELGHILRIEETHWICLSPACDMEPNRSNPDKVMHQPDHREDLKRFIALKLRSTSIGVSSEHLTNSPTPKNVLRGINKIGTIFANIETEEEFVIPTAFQIVSNSNASPVWMTMYAHNDGLFDKREKNKINVKFLKWNHDTSALDIHQADAKICGQLRYEYALNVQSKLAQSLSRIGLNYSGP